MAAPLIVLRAGDAAPPVAARRGEFFDWIRREASSEWPGEFVVHDVRNMDLPLPEPGDAAGFVITGSSSSVTERAPWMLRCEELVRRIVAAGVPLFGICFGHQLIAQALGGEVTKNPRGREIGTVEVRALAADPILDGLPATFDVNGTHVDAVSRLPPGAVVLAETGLDPVAAFAIGENVKCVQFHPEFDGDVMRGYLDARRALIEGEGIDFAKLRAVDAPCGARMLKNFVRLVVGRA